MKKVRALALFNFLAFLLHVGLSYATQFKLFNNQDVAQVSNKYTSLFTPAGITFAIWGLIYVSLCAFCIYHIIKAWTRGIVDPANEDVQRMGGWFILNNLVTAAWLLAWTNEYIALSLGLIIVQLVTLAIINLRLHIYNPVRVFSDRVFSHFPLSIYFGWITIATIANASIYLVAIGWQGYGLRHIDWARIMIGAAVIISLLVVLTRRNVFYGLVIIWALYGIVLKLNQTDSIEYFEIIQAAWIGIAVMGLVCILQLIKNNLPENKFEPPFPAAPHSLK